MINISIKNVSRPSSPGSFARAGNVHPVIDALTPLAKTTKICGRGLMLEANTNDLCSIQGRLLRLFGRANPALVPTKLALVSCQRLRRIQSHKSTTITEVRQSTVVRVLSSPDSQLVTFVQYELTDVDAVVKMDGLGAGQQRHVGWTRGGRDGA